VCIQAASHSSPPRRLPRLERQASIVRAAARAFARAGFDGTSMDDVATEAGVTRLIVYRNFDSKNDLYRAVLEHTTGRLAAAFEHHRAAGRNFAVRALLEVARADPDGVRLLWLHAAHEPEFADHAAAFRAGVIAYARELLDPLIDDPRWRPWAARVVVDHLYDAVLTWLEVGAANRDEEFIALVSSGMRAMLNAWAIPV
jgi:AcrR family transcriptional regulator